MRVHPQSVCVLWKRCFWLKWTDVIQSEACIPQWKTSHLDTALVGWQVCLLLLLRYMATLSLSLLSLHVSGLAVAVHLAAGYPASAALRPTTLFIYSFLERCAVRNRKGLPQHYVQSYTFKSFWWCLRMNGSVMQWSFWPACRWRMWCLNLIKKTYSTMEVSGIVGVTVVPVVFHAG